MCSLGLLNDVADITNDPSLAADGGNGFLMRQGYTILVSGWDVTVSPGGGRLTISVPLARQQNGGSVVGPALEEFVIDNNTTETAAFTYPAASLNRSDAVLTVRSRYVDTPVPVTTWEYVHDRAIRPHSRKGRCSNKGGFTNSSTTRRIRPAAGIAFAATERSCRRGAQRHV